MVSFGEGEPGGEGLVPEEGPDGRNGVGQGARALLEPGGEGPRGLHPEPDRGDVHVVVVAGEAEVHVYDLAFRYRLAGALDVLRYLQGTGEVVGRAEG